MHWLRLRDEERPLIHSVAAHRKSMNAVATEAFQLRVPANTDHVICDTPAAMNKHDDRLAATGIGRREHIEHIARVRAVAQIAGQRNAGVGLCRLQRRVDCRGPLYFDPRADLA